MERWFGLITQHAIHRGSFKTVKELIKNIDAYVAQYNIHARPVVWTVTADSVLQQIERLCKVIKDHREGSVGNFGVSIWLEAALALGFGHVKEAGSLA
jgi:hypothetical protein